MLKKHLRSVCILFAALLLSAALLAGCGASGGAANSSAAMAPEDAKGAADYGDYDGETAAAQDAGEAAGGGEASFGGEGGAPTLTPPQDGRKVIMNANVGMETLEFSASCTAIEKAIAAAGGYIAASELWGTDRDTNDTVNPYSSRSATFTARVPATAYTGFLTALGDAGTITSRTESSEDITQQYVDVEARLKALRTQEARLLDLMEQSASLKDLLEVQSQLTEVQYQIETYEGTKQAYDDLVAYSTVTIQLQEVREISETPPDTYGDRMDSAFRQSWQNFATFWQEFSIGFVYVLPGLLAIVAIVVVVLLILRAVLRRRKNHAPQPLPPFPPPPYPAYPQDMQAPAATSAWQTGAQSSPEETPVAAPAPDHAESVPPQDDQETPS